MGKEDGSTNIKGNSLLGKEVVFNGTQYSKSSGMPEWQGEKKRKIRATFLPTNMAVDEFSGRTPTNNNFDNNKSIKPLKNEA